MAFDSDPEKRAVVAVHGLNLKLKRFTTEFHGETLNFNFNICEIFVQISSKNMKKQKLKNSAQY